MGEYARWIRKAVPSVGHVVRFVIVWDRLQLSIVRPS